MQNLQFEPPADERFLQLFFKLYMKPLIKEALDEFLKENGVTLVNNKQPPGQLLTGQQVAELLCVERHTVSNMIKKGLPCVFIGDKARRFRVEDVNAFIEKSKA
jgi:excisionase family DNA binding protein